MGHWEHRWLKNHHTNGNWIKTQELRQGIVSMETLQLERITWAPMKVVGYQHFETADKELQFRYVGGELGGLCNKPMDPAFSLDELELAKKYIAGE